MMLMRMTNIIHFLIRVLSIPFLFAVSQGLPSPGVYFTKKLENASIEGIAEDSNGQIYLTTNQVISGDNLLESWVYKFNSRTGDTISTKRITSGRSKVGTCSLTTDETILVVSPFHADWQENVGIQGVSAETLDVVWLNSVARQSMTGIAPLIIPQSDLESDIIVYHSMNDGIIVLDSTGRMLWTATNVKTAQVAVTESSLFTVNQSAGMNYPLVMYSLNSGSVGGSIRPFGEGTTGSGVVVSPDQQYIYTLRSGRNRGLYRNRANLLFPPRRVTDKISDATRFGPLLSPDGNILYVTNVLNAVIEAYSILDNRILWRSTLCPTIPSILSQDGASLYSFTCGGDLVRLDALTSDFIWRYSNFTKGFIPSSMGLSEDGSHLLVAGTVTAGGETGYAFAFLTEQDEVIAPSELPVSMPTPETTNAPSIQDSEIASNALPSIGFFFSPIAPILTVIMIIV